MKKLRIKFWQIENLVVMKVLKQSEKLRNKGVIFKSDNLDMAIHSAKVPDMYFNTLFIRGKIKEKDNTICSKTFKSIGDATVYIEKCQELISDYNNTILEEEEGVVKTFIFE